jgi:hypothetical protein
MCCWRRKKKKNENEKRRKIIADERHTFFNKCPICSALPFTAASNNFVSLFDFLHLGFLETRDMMLFSNFCFFLFFVFSHFIFRIWACAQCIERRGRQQAVRCHLPTCATLANVYASSRDQSLGRKFLAGKFNFQKKKNRKKKRTQKKKTFAKALF